MYAYGDCVLLCVTMPHIIVYCNCCFDDMQKLALAAHLRELNAVEVQTNSEATSCLHMSLYVVCLTHVWQQKEQ